jgi:hypothetical protein
MSVTTAGRSHLPSASAPYRYAGSKTRPRELNQQILIPEDHADAAPPVPSQYGYAEYLSRLRPRTAIAGHGSTTAVAISGSAVVKKGLLRDRSRPFTCAAGGIRTPNLVIRSRRWRWMDMPRPLTQGVRAWRRVASASDSDLGRESLPTFVWSASRIERRSAAIIAVFTDASPGSGVVSPRSQGPPAGAREGGVDVHLQQRLPRPAGRVRTETLRPGGYWSTEGDPEPNFFGAGSDRRHKANNVRHAPP